MAAAGQILARCHAMLRAKARAGRHDRRARRGGREVHPLPGRRAGLQGLPRLPGLDLRVAELDGRARDPGRLRARARRRAVDRHRRGARRLGGRRRDHASRSATSRRSPRGCWRPRAAALFEAVEQCRRRQPPRRRLARRPGAGRGGRLLGDPLAGRPRHRPRDARGPADPELRRARHRPRARGGHGAGDRADGQRRRRTDVRMGRDNWAVYSQDGSLAAHFEHTVAVTAEGPRILTPWHLETGDDGLAAGQPLRAASS